MDTPTASHPKTWASAPDPLLEPGQDSYVDIAIDSSVNKFMMHATSFVHEANQHGMPLTPGAQCFSWASVIVVEPSL